MWPCSSLRSLTGTDKVARYLTPTSTPTNGPISRMAFGAGMTNCRTENEACQRPPVNEIVTDWMVHSPDSTWSDRYPPHEPISRMAFGAGMTNCRTENEACQQPPVNEIVTDWMVHSPDSTFFLRR